MNPPVLLQRAIQIATEAHFGQFDKVGEPYILHPLRIMFSFRPYEFDKRIVAVMHDLLEDTNVKMEHLKTSGFSHEQLGALQLLTHPKGQPYAQYIASLNGHSYIQYLARQVKRADILDNMSMERLIRLDPETINRLQKKYTNALKMLDWDGTINSGR